MFHPCYGTSRLSSSQGQLATCLNFSFHTVISMGKLAEGMDGEEGGGGA